MMQSKKKRILITAVSLLVLCAAVYTVVPPDTGSADSATRIAEMKASPGYTTFKNSLGYKSAADYGEIYLCDSSEESAESSTSETENTLSDISAKSERTLSGTVDDLSECLDITDGIESAGGHTIYRNLEEASSLTVCAAVPSAGVTELFNSIYSVIGSVSYDKLETKDMSSDISECEADIKKLEAELDEADGRDSAYIQRQIDSAEKSLDMLKRASDYTLVSMDIYIPSGFLGRFSKDGYGGSVIIRLFRVLCVAGAAALLGFIIIVPCMFTRWVLAPALKRTGPIPAGESSPGETDSTVMNAEIKLPLQP